MVGCVFSILGAELSLVHLALLRRIRCLLVRIATLYFMRRSLAWSASFMTGVKQTYSRDYKIAIDTLTIGCQVWKIAAGKRVG